VSPSAAATVVKNELLQLDNVFPKDTITKLAAMVTGPTAYGWLHELRIARDLAVSEPTALIQVGAHSPSFEIELALKKFFGDDYRVSASTTPAKGRVGGDVVVWRKNDTNQRTTFIQAKTATKKTLAGNVEEAANQLASLTASGSSVGKAHEREFTYTGGAYEGAIMVEYMPRIDWKLMKSAALDALQGKHHKFVHRVVYKDATASDYTEFTRDKPDGTSSETNPLFNATQAGTA